MEALKKKGRISISLIMAILMVLLSVLPSFAVNLDDNNTSVPAYVTSSSQKAIWLDGCSVAGTSEIDAVKWYEEAGTYYFFMPTSADLSNVTLYHNFASVKINDLSVTSGMSYDLSSQDLKTGNIVADGKTYKFEIMQSSQVGTIFMTTESGSMDVVHEDKDHKEPGEILVIDTDGKTVAYDNVLEYVKGRGNTTWRLEKKPYNIKLDKKESLFGMSESKKWCLLANAQEHSMIRNSFAYDMADEMGLAYAPESTFADVYANGVYMGTYQVSEKIEVGDSNLVKVNDLKEQTEDLLKDAGLEDDLESYPVVSEGTQGRAGYRYGFDIPMNPEDITGGYLLELVYGNEEVAGFITDRSQNVDIKGPEGATFEQVTYIANFYQEMEDALYSGTGYNDLGKHYSEYIDVEDAAKMYLLQEFVMNIDTGISSCYFYKESDTLGDGKLHLSPAWDFDVSLGNLPRTKDGVNLLDYEKMFASISRLSNDTSKYTIFGILCKQDDFNEVVLDVWNDYFVPAYKVFEGESPSTGRLQSYQTYTSTISDTAQMNYIRWDLTNHLLVEEAGVTHEEHLDYLYNWMSGRFAYLSKMFTSIDEVRKLTIADLDKAYSSYDKNDYTQEEYDNLTSVWLQATADINSATSTTQITNIYNTAIKNMANAVSGVAVYFDNSQTNWETVYIFWWGGSDSPSWPGNEMQLLNNGDMAKYILPSDVENVIFTNGLPEGEQKEQTENLIYGGANNYFTPDMTTKEYNDQREAYCFDGSWTEYTPSIEPVKGDVSLDGSVTIIDTLYLQRYLASINELSETALANADMNADNKVNTIDSLEIQKIIANIVA